MPTGTVALGIPCKNYEVSASVQIRNGETVKADYTIGVLDDTGKKECQAKTCLLILIKSYSVDGSKVNSEEIGYGVGYLSFNSA